MITLNARFGATRNAGKLRPLIFAELLRACVVRVQERAAFTGELSSVEPGVYIGTCNIDLYQYHVRPWQLSLSMSQEAG